MKTLNFWNGGWCYLYSLPDLGRGVEEDPETGETVLPRLEPGHAAKFGRTHPDTGAYYICLTQGTDPRTGKSKISRDYDASLVYPERVFVWGEDNDGEPMSREEVQEIVSLLGLRGKGFWEAVEIHHGYNRGQPTWHCALRAHTDMGVRWWDVCSKLSGELPDGFTVDWGVGWERQLCIKEEGDDEEGDDEEAQDE